MPLTICSQILGKGNLQDRPLQERQHAHNNRPGDISQTSAWKKTRDEAEQEGITEIDMNDEDRRVGRGK